MTGQPEEPKPPGPRSARRRASRLVDIAEAVGVHTSTVSRVLNGDPAQSVRPEVYEKIWRTARQQGYRPNALARALKRRRTGALAFVIPLLRNPIWVRLQRAALRRASERGYVVMIMEEPGDDPQPPASYRYLVEESRADGLLLATSLRIPAHADGGPAVPHVYVNRRGAEHGNDVVMDEPAAVRLFLEHVGGLGHPERRAHRRAVRGGHRAPPRDGGPPYLRRPGHAAHRAARRRDRGRRLGGHAAVAAPRGAGAGASREGAPDRRAPGRGALPTACAVGSLNQLFGVMAALRAAGLAVPADMSVVSLDEDKCLAFLDVPVTSVAMPLAELGSAAVDALIARIDQGAGLDQETGGDVMIRGPMSLVLRESVAGPPSHGARPERR